MPPSPIPAPLPPWAKVLLYIAPAIPTVLQEAVDFIGQMFDGSSSEPDEWRRFVYVWRHTGAIDEADNCITTFDIVNITNGSIDNSWNDADYTTVWSKLDAYLNWYVSIMGNSTQIFESKAYRMAFNPMSEAAPFAKSGPPVKTRTHNMASVNSNVALPSQVSITTTELTPYRSHWGRNYMPLPAVNTVQANGHILATTVDNLATTLTTCYSGLAAAEMFPVVPVTQVQVAGGGSIPSRNLLGVTDVQVDDIFDIQRRRRTKTTTRISRGNGAGVKAFTPAGEVPLEVE